MTSMPELLSTQAFAALRTAGKSQALGLIAAIIFVAAAIFFRCFIYRPWACSYGNLPGPERSSLFWGNLKEIVDAPPMVMHTRWTKAYGKTIRYWRTWGNLALVTTDPGAIAFVSSQPDVFQKNNNQREFLGRTLGRHNFITAEGNLQKRLRRMISPSFAPGAVKRMSPVFYTKAYELRDKLASFVERRDSSEEPCFTPPLPEDEANGGRKIDVMRYVGQTALDIIGLTGFGYNFKALSGASDELYVAFRDLFLPLPRFNPVDNLSAIIPFFSFLPSKRNRVLSDCRDVIKRIGPPLLEEKKQAVRQSMSDKLEKDQDWGKDLLSVIVRANMASDLRPDQRLSDEELLAQTLTFVFAGNETVAAAVTWGLYELSRHPQLQSRLRQECLSVNDDQPDLDTLNALPLLENVTRELLRFHPNLTFVNRQVTRRTVVPLSCAVRGQNGRMMDHFVVEAGHEVFIPIYTVNRDEDVWGPTADEFDPDRYDHLPETAHSTSGMYGGHLGFWMGPRQCIGQRFAVAETKAILFVLLRSLIFDTLASNPQVERKLAGVVRPWVVGEESVGLQLPLLVRQV